VWRLLSEMQLLYQVDVSVLLREVWRNEFLALLPCGTAASSCPSNFSPSFFLGWLIHFYFSLLLKMENYVRNTEEGYRC